MEGRKRQRQAGSLFLRAGALAAVVTVATAGNAFAGIGSGGGGGGFPDVQCNYNPVRNTCVNQSTDGQAGGASKPPSSPGPRPGGSRPSGSHPGGATVCTAKDPSTGNSVTG